jgi:transposase
MDFTAHSTMHVVKFTLCYWPQPAGKAVVVQKGDKLLRARRQPPPPLDRVKLYRLRADQLRVAIRNNQVSFPSQVPIFERHDRPDLQRSIVQLYFTLGWSCETIAMRYGMIRQRIGQILRTWQKRAVEMGYIQYIPPAESVEFCHRHVRVALFPVLTNSRGQAVARNPALESSGETPSYRPRKKVDLPRILEALKQLASGRTASEVAAEVGVSPQTVCSWRDKYGHPAGEVEEVRSLKQENAQLKSLLANLSRSQHSTGVSQAL